MPSGPGSPLRVFVAGATGAIGRYAVPLLVRAGHQVTGVARTPEKRRQLEEQGARPVMVDLFDPAQVDQAVRDMEVVVNLTTAVPPPDPRILLRRSWRQMDRIRREVSANLVDAALRAGSVQRVVQESFAPILADGGDAWLDESAPVRPASYNRSTLDAEAAAARFTASGGAGVVLRFGLFYGPGDPSTVQLIEGIRRGRFGLPGRRSGYVSWLSHEDAGSAVLAGLDVTPGTYHVVEDEPTTRQALGEGIARLLDVGPPKHMPAWTVWLAGPVAETVARSLRISNRRFREAGRWSPACRSALDGFAAIIRG